MNDKHDLIRCSLKRFFVESRMIAHSDGQISPEKTSMVAWSSNGKIINIDLEFDGASKGCLKLKKHRGSMKSVSSLEIKIDGKFNQKAFEKKVSDYFAKQMKVQAEFKLN